MTTTTPRVFARDFSGYYDFPPGRANNNKIVVGEFTATAEGNGPVSLAPRHTWNEAEVRSSTLIGVDGENNLRNEAERSTFKVVRAVSEVECIGYMDTINAYDSAIISVGLFHWTVGRPTHSQLDEKDGELCGLLAYLAEHNPEAYYRVLRNFGIITNKTWKGTGQDLFKMEYRKYSGWVSFEEGLKKNEELPRTLEDANYLRSWHWFYRFQMAMRTASGVQSAMWNYARIRIRDILSIPWGVPTDVNEHATPNGKITVGGSERDVNIFDVFTSEKAVALLLRAHVLLPKPTVIQDLKAGNKVREALKAAKTSNSNLNWNLPPTDWGNNEEKALLENLLTSLKSAFSSQWHKDSIQNVNDYPIWNESNNPRQYDLDTDAIDPGNPELRISRNSFKFDLSGLPPKPNYA
jgi:hypothetical protein